MYLEVHWNYFALCVETTTLRLALFPQGTLKLLYFSAFNSKSFLLHYISIHVIWPICVWFCLSCLFCNQQVDGDNFRPKCIYVAVMMRRIMDAILNKDAMDDKVVSISIFHFFFLKKEFTINV